MPHRLLWVSFAIWSSLAALAAPLATAADPDQPVRKPFGIEKRVPWTTSKVIGSPEPPPPYRTARAFPALTFSEPLELAPAPGTNRLWVAERKGKLPSRRPIWPSIWAKSQFME
jgi:hypothetical protein